MSKEKALKLINEYLAKQEPQKVELALVDDVRAEMAQANKGAMKGIDMIEAAKRPLENSLRDNKELFKKLQRTKKAAIELGASDI